MSADNVVFITRNFPPLTGGMERLTFHAYKALREQYECGLVGPTGCRAFAAPDAPAMECRLKPLPRFLIEAWIKSRKLAHARRPRLILAASGLTAPLAIAAAKRAQSRVITVVHGLDLIASHPVYRKAFIPAIRRSDRVIANSANTARLARNAGVAADKIVVLHPGVTLPAELGGDNDFRAVHELNDRHILLSVGRLVPRKGLAEFIERALPTIIKRDPRAVLVIAGGEATDALKRDAGVVARIRRTVEQHGLQEHVRLLGRITDDAMLGKLYQASDVFIMPLIEQPDDVEGFGMVAIEAAAHGLPTAGFSLGGLPDAVATDSSGLLAPPNDYSALTDGIINLLNNAKSTDITPASCRAHAKQYSWSRYGSRLRHICSNIAPPSAAK